MAQPDKDELRREVITAIKDLRNRQWVTWEYIKNDVTAASEKFATARIEFLEERVRKLAAGSPPTLAETVLGFVMVFFPTLPAVQGIVRHWERSRQLGRVVGVIGVSRSIPGKPMSQSRVKALIDSEGFLGPAGRTRTKQSFLQEVAEHNEDLMVFTNWYAPEFSGLLQSKIKEAAISSSKPGVPQETIFDSKASATAKRPGSDSTDLLKNIRDWMSCSQISEDRALQDLHDEIDKTADVDKIRAGQKFVDLDVFSRTKVKESYDRTAFQRFIEICLWCTTWDFRPRFQPASSQDVLGLVKARSPAGLLAPPMGADFWKFALSRYVDPFHGDGTRTYAKIGNTKTLGRIPTGSLEPRVASAKIPIFTPETRLAFHWGDIIAPGLLSLNKEIAERLLRQGGAAKGPQSTPSENDIFWQYMRGLKQLPE